MMPRLLRSFTLALLCIAQHHSLAQRADSQIDHRRAVENLAAFAQLYGYVRYFSPSDQAAAVDWGRFGIHGVRRIRGAQDNDELKTILRDIFQPVAPLLQLADASQGIATVPPEIDGSAAITYSQYKSRSINVRAIPGTRGDRAPIFSPSEGPPTPFVGRIGTSLAVHMPITLSLDDSQRTLPISPAGWDALQTELAEIDPEALSPSDWEFRVAGIIEVWAVMQHFHPYLDVHQIDWNATLRPSLLRALSDRDEHGYHATLSELVAQLQDGHGVVRAPRGLAGIAFRVEVVQGRLVVTAAAKDAPFQRGDVVVDIDGQPALSALQEVERCISGSPQIRRYRALNRFSEGIEGSIARLTIQRGKETMVVELTRSFARPIFFNPTGEFPYPAIEELRPGIFYISLYSLTATDFQASLPELVRARAIIFDARWHGSWPDDPNDQIHAYEHLIPHLIDHEIKGPIMRIPLVTRPDRQSWDYSEHSSTIKPKEPRLKGQVVFINEPSIVSAGETSMSMIDHYELATLVGAPTAGCNGGGRFVDLLGGGQVMWTGMEVLKHDRSQLDGIGYLPDIPVKRTLAAVAEGRDEYLEAALAFLEEQRK